MENNHLSSGLLQFKDNDQDGAPFNDENVEAAEKLLAVFPKQLVIPVPAALKELAESLLLTNH